MTTERRAIILKLASEAYELDLDVANGKLEKKAGSWTIHDRNINDLLEAHEGANIVLIIGSLDDKRSVPIRTCRTCGRDYTDLECPYCRATRIRLRGKP